MDRTVVICTCKACTTNKAPAISVPDTFAPSVDRRKAAHGLVWQASHPSTGRTFRSQTGIEFA
jgi:hypothetical protein